MRMFLSCIVILGMTACTSLQDVTQDLGEARDLAKQSINRQAESVGWRDVAIRQVHERRYHERMRAAEDAIRKGDSETANKLWDEVLKDLKTYRPVEDKVENIRRVYRKIRTFDEPISEETPSR